MENLPDWAVSIIAVAVGLSPGLAILSARSIARLIYHMLGPRPEVMRELRVGQRAMSRRARQLRGCDRVQAKADPTTQAA